MAADGGRERRNRVGTAWRGREGTMVAEKRRASGHNPGRSLHTSAIAFHSLRARMSLDAYSHAAAAAAGLSVFYNIIIGIMSRVPTQKYNVAFSFF